MKIVFIPVSYKRELSNEFMNKILKAMPKMKDVGIFTTVQFLKQMQQLKVFLEDNGKSVFIGKPSFRASKPGQVLGCDITAPLSIEKRVECFIYLGSGEFHPLSLAIRTNKRIICANPLTEQLSEISKEKIEQYKKRRANAINSVKNGKYIGILMTTKYGQQQKVLAEKIEEKLKKKGKKVYKFFFETLVPEELYNFPDIDAWINTACQRIALDDLERFPKPVANAEDVI